MAQTNEFYQRLADHYDEMTRFRQRFTSERQTIQNWLERLQIQSAVDAACGTGLHAILMAAQGARTVGADISAAMLQQAVIHAKECGVTVTWLQTAMQELHLHLQEKYDAVFCLGNSLPHLLKTDDLNATLQSFTKLLQTDGWIVLQLLNYDRILNQQDRIIGIDRQGAREYIRFYDFQEELLQFNILTISETTAGKIQYELNSTPLYPYRQKELLLALSEHGFGQIECYGNLEFSSYASASSPNLVLLARKTSKCRDKEKQYTS